MEMKKQENGNEVSKKNENGNEGKLGEKNFGYHTPFTATINSKYIQPSQPF